MGMGITNTSIFIKHEVMQLGIPGIKKKKKWFYLYHYRVLYYITEVFPCTL